MDYTIGTTYMEYIIGTTCFNIIIGTTFPMNIIGITYYGLYYIIGIMDYTTAPHLIYHNSTKTESRK